MSETTPQRPTRRARTPKQDPLLAAAVDLARDAVLAPVPDQSSVGEHLGVTAHEDRLLTHLFDCRLTAYPGWTWYATVARAPRSKHVTVCETGLVAGPDSLLAPDWVPWEERMQALQEQDEQASPEEGEGHSAGENDPTSEGSGSHEHPELRENMEDHRRAGAQDESVHRSARTGDLPAGAAEESFTSEDEPTETDSAEDGATS